MKRIFSIDFARGLVMIIMPLDHVRELMHINSLTGGPTNLATTTPILFFTRWITYLCAPIFVFLAGTSAYLSNKKRTASEAKKFLAKRGFWLIVLEFTLVNFGMFFDPGFHTLIFEVIGAIGAGFVILSLLLELSPSVIAMIGLVIFFGHNIYDIISFSDHSIVKEILDPLITLKVYPVSGHSVLIIAYPVIPWLGIMLLGYGSGKLFEYSDQNRKKLFTVIGILALLLFVGLRILNGYGDPVPWAIQKNSLFTFLSYVNVTKYPPSLLFGLVTLGILFLIFAIVENVRGKFMDFVSVYGKVPLFYFLVHFYLVHLITIVLMLVQGFRWSQLDFASGNFGRPKGVESGVSLGVIYIIWICVVLALYKPCAWFGKYKSTHTQWWLKYI